MASLSGKDVKAVFARWLHKSALILSGRTSVLSGLHTHDEGFLWAPAQRKRTTMLYFANVFYLFIYFLWPPYSPALVNGGSRKFYTW